MSAGVPLSQKAPAVVTNEKLLIQPGCAVCTEAFLEGDIRIGAGTVVHPRAHISAESGPIIIGENNLIEENVIIINRHSSMTIGNNNWFEVGSKFEASSLGDNNLIEVRAEVGPKAILTNGCTVGPTCRLSTAETIPENTMVYGEKCKRKSNAEKPTMHLFAQLENLRKCLPNYHYLHSSQKSEA